jgi:hypothetical protein
MRIIIAVQRRLAIAERGEELMRQWRARYPSNVIDEEVFFNEQRSRRRRDRAGDRQPQLDVGQK